jgi:hypothetical protein
MSMDKHAECADRCQTAEHKGYRECQGDCDMAFADRMAESIYRTGGVCLKTRVLAFATADAKENGK